MEMPKVYTLRFVTRNRGRRNPVEVVHMYDSTGNRVFHAFCDRSVLTSFVERLNVRIERSKTGKTLKLIGDGAEDKFRRIVVFASVRQCIRSPSKALDVADVVAGLGEFEVVFWYTKILSAYEKKGLWGVCRVAKAFRTLYRID